MLLRRCYIDMHLSSSSSSTSPSWLCQLKVHSRREQPSLNYYNNESHIGKDIDNPTPESNFLRCHNPIWSFATIPIYQTLESNNIASRPLKSSASLWSSTCAVAPLTETPFGHKLHSAPIEWLSMVIGWSIEGRTDTDGYTVRYRPTVCCLFVHLRIPA